MFRCFTIVAAFLISSCGSNAVRSDADTATTCRNSGRTDSGLSAGSSGYDLQSTDSEITFYKDIFPILNSQTAGDRHKCTVCHLSYREPKGVASVDEVESIIAVTNNKSMPLQGDPLQQNDIETIMRWRLTGFRPGDPSQKPREVIDPSVYQSQRGCN